MLSVNKFISWYKPTHVRYDERLQKKWILKMYIYVKNGKFNHFVCTWIAERKNNIWNEQRRCVSQTMVWISIKNIFKW